MFFIIGVIKRDEKTAYIDVRVCDLNAGSYAFPFTSSLSPPLFPHTHQHWFNLDRGSTNYQG